MSNLSLRKMKETLEEQQEAERKEMEEKKREIIPLLTEIEELELTISKQEAELKCLSAEIEKLEKETSVSQREMLLYCNLKSWIETVFCWFTDGPCKERFSKFKDPIQQLEVIRDFIRLVRDENTDKAETSPQQD